MIKPDKQALPNDTIWQAIWDNVNLGLILVDQTGRVRQWNDWVAKRSGIPAKSAEGHTLESLFQDELNPPFKSALKNSLTHRLPVVLSNALHRSPLPLFPWPETEHQQTRIQQSIAITPLTGGADEHFCLIQITDTSISIKRERVLKLHSEQLSIDANTDALTGAHNRRYFDERYKIEFNRAQRQGTPLSLLMLDIDFFKDYNDNYGHPAGDKVLIAVVAAIKSQLNRATDVVTRYGGEEFAVILPDCEAPENHAMAEKLRRAVSNLNIPHCKSKITGTVTLSIGITTLECDAKCSADRLLETADTALYEAKHAGRNRVNYLGAAE